MGGDRAGPLLDVSSLGRPQGAVRPCKGGTLDGRYANSPGTDRPWKTPLCAGIYQKLAKMSKNESKSRCCIVSLLSYCCCHIVVFSYWSHIVVVILLFSRIGLVSLLSYCCFSRIGLISLLSFCCFLVSVSYRCCHIVVFSYRSCIVVVMLLFSRIGLVSMLQQQVITMICFPQYV